MARVSDRNRQRVVFRRVEMDATRNDPIVRSVLRHETELEPDPRFARRLRGIVLSRHVAAREGYVLSQRRIAMTPIGRGVLVSSVLLAISAGSVGAFSQSALPDDPLYMVKLRLEALRMAVAPPDLRDDLLVMALEERTRELTMAAGAGRWNAAEEAAWRVAITEDQLVALNALTPGVAARIEAHLHALDQVMAHAPASAAAIVAERLNPARETLTNRGRGGTGAAGPVPGANPGAGAPSATAQPTRSPAPSQGQPQPSNRSVASHGPAATDRPSPSAPAPNGEAPTDDSDS